ncbi:class I SAM-dependent methyltransferase [Ramlibacter sp.]|uniref:class I SAM-dependent methyltransferase n=1 Tax=Ramlibacter sp. TaxID=1917967 RepID=UPI003D09AE47
MSDQIIGMREWFETPPGRYLLEWERAAFDEAVADIFGYHALQLGLPEFDALRTNRMPHKWLGTADAESARAHPAAAFAANFAALPFEENSVDLVVLPHSLELNVDPHATLREVERVLVPEGKVVICCLNPASLWGLRQRRAHLYRRLGFGELYLPDAGDFIGYWRLRDWLRLLSFEVESGSFGCYRPAMRSEKWLSRFDWMDRAGERWWPIFGAAYFIVAVKRVRGARMIGAAWKTSKAIATAPVPLANRRLRRDDNRARFDS